MAILRTIRETFPGHGQVTDYVSKQGINNPVNATTTTNLAPAMLADFRSGRVRVRGFDYPGAGAGQATAVRVIAKNVSASHVIAVLPSFAASDLFDILISFGPLEIAATSVDVAITMANVANGQLTADFELCVNP